MKSITSELLTYRQKAVDNDGFGGVGCEPKTVRFLRLQREADDCYSTKSERKNWPLFLLLMRLGNYSLTGFSSTWLRT